MEPLHSPFEIVLSTHEAHVVCKLIGVEDGALRRATLRTNTVTQRVYLRVGKFANAVGTVKPLSSRE